VRPYEVMVIFDAEREDAELRATLDRYTSTLKGQGAELGQVDVWGKRRFAYRMKHRWEGYYVVFQVRSEPGPMQEMDRAMGLADEVIRHKIQRIPEKVYGKLAGAAASPAE
jgi:small subunit ribosomal protein S6